MRVLEQPVQAPMSALEVVRQLDSPLASEVLRLSEAANAHPVYARLQAVGDVRVFMAHHVWAVWDFMSLLKSIQAELAPVKTPWVPPKDAEAARLINEITVAEEGDEPPDGGYASHFEIYLRAMDAVGAPTAAITDMVARIARGVAWRAALADACPLPPAIEFVATTLELTEASLPERVAAFTIGREEIIPGMFRQAVQHLDQASVPGADLRLFRWYLDRHIVLDGDRHGPFSARLLQRICLADSSTRDASLTAAIRTLSRRLSLWDAAAAKMPAADRLVS